MRATFAVFGIILFLYVLLWLVSFTVHDVEYGISFNQDHAESLGLGWPQVYSDMLEELNPPYVRIAAMWSGIEPQKGVYDFSDIDIMMDMAREHGVRIMLVVGQKAPRWPECHVPDWINGYADEEAREHLLSYVGQVVDRYKDHKALELWQVENEPFIRFEFGDCAGYQEEAIYEEIALIREKDGAHEIVITDSGELGTWRKAIRTGDIFGTTLYRIVRTPGGHVISYDWLPPAFYRIKARLFGADISKTFISELQAEPWFTDSTPLDTSVEEQEKTMNPERFLKHADYAERIGFPRVYLWGVEWWYWMKALQGDARYWDAAKSIISN